jgi:hypothetical protein
VLLTGRLKSVAGAAQSVPNLVVAQRRKLLTAAASQALGFVGLPRGDLFKQVRFGPAMEGCRSVSTLNVRGQVSGICLA